MTPTVVSEQAPLALVVHGDQNPGYEDFHVLEENTEIINTEKDGKSEDLKSVIEDGLVKTTPEINITTGGEQFTESNSYNAAFMTEMPTVGSQHTTIQHYHHHSLSHCPSCGAALGQVDVSPVDTSPSKLQGSDAQRRIAELEAQLKTLSEKASAAADKLANYEDELQKLRRQHAPTIATTNLPLAPPLVPPPAHEQHLNSRPTTAVTPTQRISAFLSIATRRGAMPPSPPCDLEPRPGSSPNSQPLSKELERLLVTEKQLREQAEGKLQQVTSELEELSATLFQQANEMVANERKARSKLEERVAVLEKRDREKGERLEALERAVERINRVKMVLSDGNLV